MTNSMREAFRLVALSALPTCALVALGLRLGGTVSMGAAVLVACLPVTVVLLRRIGGRETAVILASAAAFASSWGAVSVGDLQVADGLWAAALLAAAAYVGRHGTRWRLPWWIVALAVTIGVVACVHELMPVSSSYLSARDVLVTAEVEYGGAESRSTSSLLTAGKWLVAVLGLPLIVTMAQSFQPRAVLRIAVAWAAGVAVSALVAVADAGGLTGISASLLPVTNLGGRQAGLASGVNNLAISAAMATPVFLWIGARPGRLVRVLGAVGLSASGAGIYVSGSRGGAVGFAFAIALYLLVVTGAGARLRVAVASVVLGVVALAFLLGGVGVVDLLDLVRDPYTAAASNAERAVVTSQALADVAYSPAFGVGYGVITQGFNLLLQVAAAGGILVVLAFVLVQVNVIASIRVVGTVRSEPVRTLSWTLWCSHVVWLFLGLFENQITDRYLYVPLACLAAVLTTSVPDSAEADRTVVPVQPESRAERAALT
ncbi:O-antigen ligase family protein [Actinomycetospora sp. OC33-EN08]|uniref:O-antigen ligase family protein n=1 Tax=Actinomycetospora aurantiaca TaxID=3129233 RepID=A0ABU8MID9_9PSEU